MRRNREGMTYANRKFDIERAIWRTRRPRAAMRARRGGYALLAGLLAVSLMDAGTFAIGALHGHATIEAAVTQTRSLADLLGQRSPGMRSEGLLIKTKHAGALSRMRPAAKPKLHQALKPKIAMVDLDKLLDLSPGPLVAEAPPSLTTLDVAPPSIETIVTPPGANNLPGGSPAGSPPPGSTPPGTMPPGSPPNVIIPAPSAVPEPAIWAMMLLGFAFAGWRVRDLK